MLAAPHAGSCLFRLFLWITGHLPAARRPGGHGRRPGRRADPVADLHARGHEPAVGRHKSAFTDGGPRSWPRACSPPWLARNSWVPWRPSTRWRCSCWPAAWLGVRSADCRLRPRIVLLVLAGAALAAADATKYATALFTPLVLAVAALAAWRQHRGAQWVTALLAVLASWLVLVGAGIRVGGREYWLGVTSSTLARPRSAAPVGTVLRSAYQWTGLIIVLAILGAVLASRGQARGRGLPAVLAAAALLVPLAQARLHTTVSLQEARGVRCLVRRHRGRLRDGAPEQSRPGPGVGSVMAPPIAASTLFGSMGQAAPCIGCGRTLADCHRPPIGDPFPSGPLPGGRLRCRGLLPSRRSSVVPVVRSTYFFRYPGALPGVFSSRRRSRAISSRSDSTSRIPRLPTKITADMRQSRDYYVVIRGWPVHYLGTLPLSTGLARGDRGPN